MELLVAENYVFSSWIFERAMALFYLLAFLSAHNQFTALAGEKGLLPATRILQRTSFRECPSLFHWRFSDRWIIGVTLLGMALSALVLFDGLGRAPLGASLVVWLVLWFLYLSLVNVGQSFYAFGWESMLLEAGFFTAFLTPNWMQPSWIPIWILLWMLFRVEVGAGLIKWRGDPCWRRLTCLFYHHETQPLPNPLSRYFHHMPKVVHKAGVVFSHIVQIFVPFFLFFPQPFAGAAAGLIVLHQGLLIASGNYSWLNWLTVVLAFLGFSDAQWSWVLPVGGAQNLATPPVIWQGVLCGLGLVVAGLSVKPVLNLFSSTQVMNFSYNPWHLVNTYGAFGSVTRKRYEIVLEGTRDTSPTENSQWEELEFEAKPGDVHIHPPQVAPYHLRLDWMMWFLPLSVQVGPRGILRRGYDLWYVRFVKKLLEHDPKVLALMKWVPSDLGALRARFYHYRFTTSQEKRESGAIWKRVDVDEYMPVVTYEDIRDF